MALVNYEPEGHVALVTFNRPEARNAINPEVAVRLAEAWQQVKEDDNVRVAVLTGTGSAFCAGADLGQLIPMMNGTRQPENEWDEKVATDASITSRALLRNFDTEKPVIAAVNGHAIAGGMEILQGTDMRVSVPGARFGVQEAKWALFPAGGSSVRLPVQLPYAKAMELLLTGDLISADEALQLGFLNYVTDDPLAKAMEIAQKIAANGPIAVKAIRQSARACLGVPEAQALEIESRISGPVFQTQDAIEGPKAFMEKRKPEYHGR
ncbi:MAG: enoyl-CoA hydratase-related protein [Pseudomonadales bacterium]|jgi:enoyl-CoA hydratase|nr:enoyl-CoA hydratase-related protein [Pseudomonadales bacterium]MDP6469611.1 enoyl-CoA hydratase-related protein [Pseudomonadales bacterium]MDP6827452.1 enoyl-CoA hydratase-related protein [Pseudomonadales bacterium]MDP6972186.1 enoyl-CoA hydratase-related protein [Pseudomonadales bacterium]|tara:strand:- start:2199 stop:2996 length:798 start_codon:yes stop_codon:yes gene_type:complete